jgi:SulP family sulfate permease
MHRMEAVLMNSPLVPKIITCIKEGYTLNIFARDIMAGSIVAIVALPLAIAFGIASGVSPEQGLYTAIIGGFIISFLGGSRVQIGGPTGAFVVVVYAIIQEHGYSGLAMATMMAGVMLMLMGFVRMGGVIKFIPYPMTVGFTSGIALIIAFAQVKDFLGLKVSGSSAGFLPQLEVYAENFSSLTPWSLVIGSISLAVMLLWSRLTKKVPGSLVAIIVATTLVQAMNLPVATIGTQFGQVSSSFPAFNFVGFEWKRLPELVPHALTIAILGGIESLLSAVVADGMTGRRHRSNMELVAQGAANIVMPFFGGIPATGAIARTATNIKNGAQTPVSGMVHAMVLLLILLFFGRWATLIPMASLAAVLLVVAYNMSEWRYFMRLLRSPKADILVMLCTFFLTVFVDLTVAIEVGVVLSALLFMNRMSKVTEIRHITRELQEDFDYEDSMTITTRSIPPGVEVFEIYGPFFFGIANQFKDTVGIVKSPPKVLILRMRHVMSIDATAIRALEDIVDKVKRDGTRLILSGVSQQLKNLLYQNGLRKKLVDVAIFPDIDSSLAEARRLIA